MDDQSQLGTIDQIQSGNTDQLLAFHTHNGIDSPAIDRTVLLPISLTSEVTGTLPVANGGTGKTSITAYKLIVGNGTSAPTELATGTSGQVLMSNGAASNPSFQTFVASGLFESGVGTDLVITATGNDNVVMTFATGTFTPTFIKLYYFIQGYDGGAGKYLGRKGIAVYNGTTLAMDFSIWGASDGGGAGVGSGLTGDNGTPAAVTAFENISNSTTVPIVGKTGGANDAQATFSILSVTTGQFTIRCSTTTAGTRNARYKFAYEAYA